MNYKHTPEENHVRYVIRLRRQEDYINARFKDRTAEKDRIIQEQQRFIEDLKKWNKLWQEQSTINREHTNFIPKIFLMYSP
jgi:hypothetical protein